MPYHYLVKLSHFYSNYLGYWPARKHYLINTKHINMKTAVWVTLTLLVLLGMIFVFAPVPIPAEKDCLSTKGIVAEIYEGGVKDVVFRLQGQASTYYINRGLERGLDLAKLKSALLNREVTVKYPSYRTLLDPGNSVRHISKIEYNGRTLFLN